MLRRLINRQEDQLTKEFISIWTDREWILPDDGPSQKAPLDVWILMNSLVYPLPPTLISGQGPRELLQGAIHFLMDRWRYWRIGIVDFALSWSDDFLR